MVHTYLVFSFSYILGMFSAHILCEVQLPTFLYLQLCDVWFEEIKPHLLRNNIKVHIHNKDGAGVAGAGAGDHKRERLPSGTPGCSHLDPGAASDVRASLKKSKSSSDPKNKPQKKCTKKNAVDFNKKKFYKYLIVPFFVA